MKIYIKMDINNQYIEIFSNYLFDTLVMECVLEDEVFYPEKLQGYCTYYDEENILKLKFDQSKYDDYLLSQKRNIEISKGNTMFRELSNQNILRGANDEQAYVMRYLYPDFDSNSYPYKKDDRFLWSKNDKFYKVLQDHTSQADWTPDTAVSLYVEIPDPAIEYPEYVEGTRYYKDDKITFNGQKYVCIAPEGQVCTWSPIGYPDYWQLIV